LLLTNLEENPNTKAIGKFLERLSKGGQVSQTRRTKKAE